MMPKAIEGRMEQNKPIHAPTETHNIKNKKSAGRMSYRCAFYLTTKNANLGPTTEEKRGKCKPR